jgi:hypothetical protein
VVVGRDARIFGAMRSRGDEIGPLDRRFEGGRDTTPHLAPIPFS